MSNSYMEAARRLGRPEVAGASFLLNERPEFANSRREHCRNASRPLNRETRDALIRGIHATIEPFDVAGLNRSERRNHFSVRAEDLLHAAPKLGVDEEAVNRFLALQRQIAKGELGKDAGPT